MRNVLVVVDVQKDFCAGGALEVPDSESLIQPLNQAIKKALSLGMSVIFTRDWHPKNHSSFVEFGGQWPAHCIQNTWGAEFHADLLIPDNSCHIVNAGMESLKLGYSPYEDPRMFEFVNGPGIGSVLVTGIALEYCVRLTCLETIKLGKRVVAIDPLIRSISEDKASIEKRWAELVDAGVLLAPSISEKL